MNKRSDDPNKGGEVVTIGAPQLPAVIKKTKNPWKKFTVLDQLAEDIRDKYKNLIATHEEIGRREPGEFDDGWEYALIDDDDRATVARCRELIEQLDGPENYEEADDDTDFDESFLKKSVISLRLAEMMAAVHIGGPKEGEQVAFAKTLLNHVYGAQISRIILEATCREIEGTKKYMQATSEVLDVLKEQRKEWWQRLDAINEIEPVSEKLQQRISEAQQQCEREVLEAEQKKEIEDAKEAHRKAARKFNDRLAALASAEKFAADRQDVVRTNHISMVKAMNLIAERAAELEQARAELDIAYERAEKLDPPVERVLAAAEKLKKAKDAPPSGERP